MSPSDRLLDYVRSRPGRPLSLTKLARAAYGRANFPRRDRCVRDLMETVRARLGPEEVIATVFGRGYVYLRPGVVLTEDIVRDWQDA